MSIFLENAQRHWDAGLPVIPLIAGEKAPAINKWQSFANQMPSEQEQEIWKHDFARGNMGLPLGPESGLIAIDIDTDDPKILGVFDRVLPQSPWVRIGAKGKVLIYKYDGQPSTRLKELKDGKQSSVVELLSAGTQIVLPPSIHPVTKRAYVSNCDLVSVLKEVRSLPANMIAILKDALKEVGVQLGSTSLGALTNYVSPGSRDNTMMSVAGLFASDVCRGQKTLLEACEDIQNWVKGFTKQVYGDSLDPVKGEKKVIECLIKDVKGPKHKTLPKGWDEGLTPEQKTRMGLDIFSEEDETWDFAQIMAYFNAGLEKMGVSSSPELFQEHAREVIYKIAGNKGLDNLDEGRLLRHISDTSGKKIPVSEMKRMIVEYRSGDIKGNDHTELAQATMRDLQNSYGEIRFHNDKLWNWGGSHWKHLDDAKVMNHIAIEYGSFKAASRASDHAGIMRIIKTISTKPLKTLNESGINFVNGFLTEDLDLKAHNPDHGMTYCLDYPYSPEEAGKCTKWLGMLHDYWSKDDDYADKVDALGEAMALTMFGKAASAQLAFCLIGVAGSGKSRILEIIQQLMPAEAQCSIPPTMWGDKFGIAPMANALLNYAGELSETHFIDSAKFKAVVDGSEIEAQYKNQQVFNTRILAAHWFASNCMPRSRDATEGFSRRWLFLDFPRKFPVSRRVADYHQEVVAEERTAIAAWVVQYVARLKENSWKIVDPPSSIKIRTNLENEINSVRAFLSDLQEQKRIRLGVDENEGILNPYTTSNNLFNDYRSYCVSVGVSLVKSRDFAKRMASLAATFGFQVENIVNDQKFQETRYKFITLVPERGS